MTYLTWKALHIIGMVCWFAALFYLPRLYVYHAMAQDDGEEATMRRFCVMERKLYIMGHIGMGLTLVFGGLLLWAGAGLAARKAGFGRGAGGVSGFLRAHQPHVRRRGKSPQSCVLSFF